MIGEAGKEAVVPLENNTAWIDQLADKINDKSGDGSPMQFIIKKNRFLNFQEMLRFARMMIHSGPSILLLIWILRKLLWMEMFREK